MTNQIEALIDSTEQKSRNDKILLVKGGEGLGNRILCLLSAILYARLSNRKLIIDWSDSTYSDDGSDSFPHFFTIPLVKSIGNVCISNSCGSVYPTMWKNRLHTSYKALKRELFPEIRLYSPKLTKRFSVEVSNIDYTEKIVVMLSFAEQIQQLRTHFRGKHSSLNDQNNSDILRSLSQKCLLPHGLIDNEIKLFASSYLTDTTVGVHIRYTDRRCRVEAICKKLNHLVNHRKELKIFLATDNREIERSLELQYPAQIIFLKKWYPDDGGAIHYGINCQNRLENGKKALIEMYLLGMCNYLIYDESSSFGYVASLLSHAPKSHQFNVSSIRHIPRWIRHDLWNIKKDISTRYKLSMAK